MRSKNMILSTVLMLGVACLASSRCLANDKEAVEQAAARFYSSLNALFTGESAPMEEVWSHADDVTYMGPAGGFQVGWDQVRAYWEGQAALKLGGQIAPFDTHVTIGDKLAFFQCYERGQNVNAQGEPLKVSIRATTIFRKEKGAWKVIGHQTDLLPYLEQQTLTKSQD
jgi:ketosteroid isomerase-like protein